MPTEDQYSMNETSRIALQHGQFLMDILHGYRQAQVLMTCTTLGVFEALAGGGKRSDVLAAELSLDPDALERLLNAASALGLLHRTGDVYRNSPATAACLADEEKPGYLGNIFRREDAFYDRWGRLTQAVRTGRRPEDNRAMEDTDNWVRDFEYGLYDLARLYGPTVADTLALQPEEHPWRVLDVGGGHGGYSIALARRYPRLSAVVVDLPPVIEVAEEIVAGTDVAGRVTLRAGDFLVADMGRGYDVALVFGVLLSEPPDRRQALLRRVHTALKPGGVLVLREFVLDDDGMGPAETLLFDLQMLLSTEAGGALKRSAFVAELKTAGFGQIETRPLAEAGLGTLWLAYAFETN